MSAASAPGQVVNAVGEPADPGSARPAGGEPSRVRLTAVLGGWVQGVGFRWWVRTHALELGLAGWAANLPDGRVQVVAEGPRPACEQLLGLLRGTSAPGRVTDIAAHWTGAGEDGLYGFVAR